MTSSALLALALPSGLLAAGPVAAPLGFLAPQRSSEIGESPWGVQMGDNARAELFERAGQLGVKWTRLQAGWPAVEREKSRYDFETLDGAIDNARAQGLTPFVCLTGGNGLYSQPIPHPDPSWRLVYGVRPAPPILDEDAMAAWLRFVEAAVTRGRGRVRHWEIWNEPNHYAYWGAAPDAAAYGRLVRATAERIRGVDPAAVIIAGSLAGLVPDFIEGFLKQDSGRLVDIVSFHNYANLPEARIYAADDTWRVLRAHNPKLVLWQGECGYPSHSSTRDFRGGSPWGVLVQAKWLLRQAFVDTYFLRAQLSNYFKLYDGGDRSERQERPELKPVDRILGFPAHPEGRRVRGKGVNEKCLLASPSLEPKPAFHAYRNLTALMDGRYQPAEVDGRDAIRVTAEGQFAGVGDADDAYPSVPLLAAYRTPQGDGLIAYWVPWQPQEYTPRPARIVLRLRGVSFKEPVLVNLLSGSVHALQAPARQGEVSVFAELPLFDFPLVIAERARVPITQRRSTPENDAIPSL